MFMNFPSFGVIPVTEQSFTVATRNPIASICENRRPSPETRFTHRNDSSGFFDTTRSIAGGESLLATIWESGICAVVVACTTGGGGVGKFFDVIVGTAGA